MSTVKIDWMGTQSKNLLFAELLIISESSVP